MEFFGTLNYIVRIVYKPDTIKHQHYKRNAKHNTELKAFILGEIPIALDIVSFQTPIMHFKIRE